MLKKLLVLLTIILVLFTSYLYIMGFIFTREPRITHKVKVSTIGRVGDNMVKIQLIRHATVLLSTSDMKILIDPYLSEAGKLPPIPLTSNRVRNPLVPLPFKAAELKDIDALLLTHLHNDHFDKAAKKLFSKDTLIFCRAQDEKKLQKEGFYHLKVISESIKYGELTITQFNNHHGYGLAEILTGTTASYLIKTSNSKIFITGDAVYDKNLEKDLVESNPDIVIANAGSAEFVFGKPVTMRAEDIGKIACLLPETKIIVDHMDAVNHCRLSRIEFKNDLRDKEFAKRIFIPDDGGVLSF